MNLHNFESCIDKRIVARGYDYYKNYCVISVEEPEKNVYVAEVEGSELYTVEVELDDQEEIADSQCDCPYDWGEYCKRQRRYFLPYGISRTKKTRTMRTRKRFISPFPRKEKRLI